MRPMITLSDRHAELAPTRIGHRIRLHPLQSAQNEIGSADLLVGSGDHGPDLCAVDLVVPHSDRILAQAALRRCGAVYYSAVPTNDGRIAFRCIVRRSDLLT